MTLAVRLACYIKPAVSLRALARAGLPLWLLGSSLPCASASEQIVALSTADAEPYRVALRGFQEALSHVRPDIAIQEYLLKDPSHKERLLADIRQRKPALVLTLGSTATALAQTGLQNTPVVFCMVLNPEASGLVQSMQASGNNLTGASLDVPVRLQFEALQSLLPSAKRIGVFYNPLESEKLIQPAAKAAASLGLDLIPIVVGLPEELAALADALPNRRLDALWSVPDSTVFASSRSLEFLARRALEARIPFMVWSPEQVKVGALLALAVDYKDVGHQCGEQAAHVLRGTPPSGLPITVPRKSTLHINMNVARAIGLRVPDSIRDKAILYDRKLSPPPPF